MKAMGESVTQKILAAHLIDEDTASGEIALKIDQTLTQDATGTLVMLEFEALKIPRVKTELSVQYVDHNLLQEDFKNADDHIFLQTAAKKFGVWFSPPGNGVSHPVHMSSFGIPGKTLLGSDSHTCAAGSLGMIAIGAGGLEVALSMAGEPFYVKKPTVWGVKLVGTLPQWVSAKDIILEMLRRHTVKGGIGKIIEYYGSGLNCLSAMDRHVIANMGAELGATTTVFPSDEITRVFLKQQQREKDWVPLIADKDATYDEYEEIDLSKLEPLIACPSSPDKVVPVREIAGQTVHQTYVGSSANPGFRDFAITAMIMAGKCVHPRVSFDVSPSSREILENLLASSHLAKLLHSGARLHQTGCNGCVGMGQAPATDRISLRTVPRNFPGRSGTKDDKVYLCSPETAAAATITGVITDPRDLGMEYPSYHEPQAWTLNRELLQAPLKDGSRVAIEKGPNIQPLPLLDPLPDFIRGPALLKVGNDISTDEIMPAGAKVLPFRSNIQAISEFVYYQIEEKFHERAKAFQKTGFFIVAGENYGQGSSREHAAIAPRYLGLRAVIAKGFARIHWQNLTNFGILPLNFSDSNDWSKIHQEDELELNDIRKKISENAPIVLFNKTRNQSYSLTNTLSKRQIEMILDGSLINVVKKKHVGQKH